MPGQSVRDTEGRALPLEDFVAVIADYFDLGPGLDRTSRLVEDLAFDSIMMVEVWDFLCDACDDDIPDEVLTTLQTVEDLHFVYAQGGSKGTRRAGGTGV